MLSTVILHSMSEAVLDLLIAVIFDRAGILSLKPVAKINLQLSKQFNIKIKLKSTSNFLIVRTFMSCA